MSINIQEKIQIREMEFTFETPILGMQPLDKEIYSKYITQKVIELGFMTQEEANDELDMIPDGHIHKSVDPDKPEMKMTGFHRDTEGVYLMAHQVMGFFKDAANRMKEKECLNITNLRSKIQNYLFVKPRYLWIKEDTDGVVQRPLRAQTPKGERISLAASEMVKDVTVKLQLHLWPHKELNWDVIDALIFRGQYLGISQWRGAGYGQFVAYETKGKKLKWVLQEAA